MRKRRSKSGPCFVYVMERTTGRSVWALVFNTKEIKIGISQNPKKRRSFIDEDVRGDVVIREVFRFPSRSSARKVEQHLHKVFKRENFKLKAGKQAGVTEWFRMSSSDYLKLLKQLDKIYHTEGLNATSVKDLDSLIDWILSKLPRWSYPLITFYIVYLLLK